MKLLREATNKFPSLRPRPPPEAAVEGGERGTAGVQGGRVAASRGSTDAGSAEARSPFATAHFVDAVCQEF